jgi:uncharacterized protein (TIGR04552 family)
VAAERPSEGIPKSAERMGLDLGDLEAVRLLLRGGSVVDWHRLEFRDQNDVERFLRVNEFDPTNERDLQRLDILRQEAVDFLRRIFNFRIPDDVAERVPVQELFMMASRRNKRQMYACIVLKVMHIIHHLAGRELLFRLPISDDEVFHLVERKVVRIVEEVRAAGHSIVEFEWSRKPRDSLILKLMAKKSTLAANVYDKLRFRLVVREERDILPLLIELHHRLIPFNYVVPGESVNDIIQFRRAVEESELASLAAQLQQDAGNEEREEEARKPPSNEFSGPGYRIINFVADMPIRLDDFICRVSDPANLEYGAIVFVLTEFQVLDLHTAQQNEQGENSHEKYKERQTSRVKQRLLRGVDVNERQQPPERPSTNPPDE